MPVAGFEELCTSYCELADFACPDVSVDAHGMQAFHLELEGVAVTVMHERRVAPDRAFIVFEFGPVPDERAQQVWPLLVDANFMMLREHAPSFGRNPRNGDVLLRVPCSFAQINPVEFRQVVDDGVQAALRWRQDFFLADEGRAINALVRDAVGASLA